MGGEAAGPEVDGGGGEGGVGGQEAGEDVVGAPPEEEEGAEEERCGEAVIEAAEAMGAELWLQNLANCGRESFRGIRKRCIQFSWCSRLDHCKGACFYPLHTESADEL